MPPFHVYDCTTCRTKITVPEAALARSWPIPLDPAGRLAEPAKPIELDHQSMDAQVWAAAFCKQFPGHDEGTMLAWFANAIMAGFDEANRRANANAAKQPVS